MHKLIIQKGTRYVIGHIDENGNVEIYRDMFSDSICEAVVKTMYKHDCVCEETIFTVP